MTPDPRTGWPPHTVSRPRPLTRRNSRWFLVRLIKARVAPYPIYGKGRKKSMQVTGFQKKPSTLSPFSTILVSGGGEPEQGSPWGEKPFFLVPSVGAVRYTWTYRRFYSSQRPSGRKPSLRVRTPFRDPSLSVETLPSRRPCGMVYALRICHLKKRYLYLALFRTFRP